MDLSPWDYWRTAAAASRTRRATPIVADARARARQSTRTTPARSTSTSTRSKRRTGRSGPKPMPTGCAAPSRRRAPRAHAVPHLLSRGPLPRCARRQQGRGRGRRGVPRRGRSAEGIYPVGYYPHNIHFVLASAQMAGDGPTAIAAAEKLAASSQTRSRAASPWCIRSRPRPTSRTRSSAPRDGARAAGPRPTRSPTCKAMWHYARGVALAATRRFAEADRGGDAIDGSIGSADFRC